MEVPIITSFFFEVIFGAGLLIVGGAAGAAVAEGLAAVLLVIGLLKNILRLAKFFIFEIN